MNSAGALIQGAGQGLLFSVFAIAAAGKLSACRPGMAAMCRKGALDGMLALAALVAWQPCTMVLALLALAIAAGGYGRERLRGNTACNCFGVLTASLHPWRNQSRALMALAATSILIVNAAGWTQVQALAWDALFGSTAVLLCLFSFLMGRGARAARATVAPVLASPQLAVPALDIDMPIGTDATGQLRSVRAIARGDRPVALLMMAHGCKACGALKLALMPLLERFDFPVVVVMEDEPGTIAGAPALLFDRGGALRNALGVKSMPALVVVGAHTGEAIGPCAIGGEAIQSTLLSLVLMKAHMLSAADPR